MDSHKRQDASKASDEESPASADDALEEDKMLSKPPQSLSAKLKIWWHSLHIPLPYIPRVYVLLKWSFLVM